MPLPDLHATIKRLQTGQSSARTEVERAIDVAQSAICERVFLSTMFDEARYQAARHGRGLLQGLAVSVKDLFDVKGQTTSAGSVVLADSPVATQDCTAVARLKAAGGVIIGRTNMSEFAFSGVGINPHHGTPSNAASSLERRIPGGSSSGAAVSVATGAAFIGLGSDTGGSIRIPAALNGIVGFKNTARLVPTDGAVPLSTTLDTVCAMTRSVRDAMLAHEILSAQRITRSSAPLSCYRLAVVKPIMQDDLDSVVSSAWQRTLTQLRACGANIEEIELPQLNELASLLPAGGFSATESYAWHHAHIQQHASQYDPRVLARILRGANMSAREYIAITQARKQWIIRMEAALRGFDAVLSPTVPIIAPLIDTVAPGPERDDAFIQVNAQLLRNTSVVNMLDGCAISIPCHQPPELPVGLMIWAPAMADDTVLNIARQVESLIAER